MSRIEKLEAFLKDSPNDSFLKHALAMEYIKIGDDEAAQRLLEENMTNDAQYVATYYHLGKLLERRMLLQHAIDVYKKGLEIARLQNDIHSFGELQNALLLIDEDE